jgi:competence protein ComEA
MSKKSFLSYTKSEKRGILVLLVLMLILTATRIFLPYYMGKSKSEAYELTFLQPREDSANINVQKKKSKQQIPIYKASVNVLTKSKVDPNIATFENLISAGFSPFVSTNILKYREKGGIFKQVSDIFRIYGVDSAQHQWIKQVVEIAVDSSAKHESLLGQQSFEDKHTIHVNIADAQQLERLPGIGSVLGKRIVKYRELLGGFFSVGQLLEVYGITDSTFKRIEPYIIVEPDSCRKIDLNRVTEIELIKHPYIQKYQAKAILKYREVMGQIKDKKELLSNQVFTKPEWEKIVPYIKDIE